MRFKAAAFILLTFSLPLGAAMKTWDGSLNGNWASALNWTPFGAPVAGDDLVFPAGAMTFTMTSFTADFNSITFSGAGYTVNGSGFGLTNGISVTHTSGTTTINVPVTLNQSEIFDVQAAAAALVLSDIVLGANLVEFSGAGETRVGGVISGSGRMLKAESGKLTLSGTSTYSGPTLVSSGTVLLQNGAALGSASGATTVNAGAALALDGGITVAENVTLNGSGTFGEGALVGVGGPNTWTG
ncbi:MAG TPA: autotransporter-associated beta strand repeat-containing protein, partial [Thermoanaerobaculia bacterium]|nr:autotransporter-associated beta strand repeat-containing protein [Thermoanaerobaculia bacterium]